MDALCRRYGCLPSQLLAEDAELLRMTALLDPDLGKKESDGR